MPSLTVLSLSYWPGVHSVCPIDMEYIHIDTPNESRELRAPNLLIWSQTRCRCAMPPLREHYNFAHTQVFLHIPQQMLYTPLAWSWYSCPTKLMCLVDAIAYALLGLVAASCSACCYALASVRLTWAAWRDCAWELGLILVFDVCAWELGLILVLTSASFSAFRSFVFGFAPEIEDREM